jgi:hypothetical protein
LILYEKLLGGKVRIIVGRYNVTGKSKKEVTESALEELEQMTEHCERGYLICGNGTVLAIYWDVGSFGYDIVHQGQRLAPDGLIRVPSSAWGNRTFEEAVEHAKNHAEQCYGGVVLGKVFESCSPAPQ